MRPGAGVEETSDFLPYLEIDSNNRKKAFNRIKLAVIKLISNDGSFNDVISDEVWKYYSFIALFVSLGFEWPRFFGATIQSVENHEKFERKTKHEQKHSSEVAAVLPQGLVENSTSQTIAERDSIESKMHTAINEIPSNIRRGVVSIVKKEYADEFQNEYQIFYNIIANLPPRDQLFDIATRYFMEALMARIARRHRDLFERDNDTEYAILLAVLREIFDPMISSAKQNPQNVINLVSSHLLNLNHIHQGNFLRVLFRDPPSVKTVNTASRYFGDSCVDFLRNSASFKAVGTTNPSQRFSDQDCFLLLTFFRVYVNEIIMNSSAADRGNIFTAFTHTFSFGDLLRCLMIVSMLGALLSKAVFYDESLMDYCVTSFAIYSFVRFIPSSNFTSLNQFPNFEFERQFNFSTIESQESSSRKNKNRHQPPVRKRASHHYGQSGFHNEENVRREGDEQKPKETSAPIVDRPNNQKMNLKFTADEGNRRISLPYRKGDTYTEQKDPIFMLLLLSSADSSCRSSVTKVFNLFLINKTQLFSDEHQEQRDAEQARFVRQFSYKGNSGDPNALGVFKLDNNEFNKYKNKKKSTQTSSDDFGNESRFKIQIGSKRLLFFGSKVGGNADTVLHQHVATFSEDGQIEYKETIPSAKFSLA